MHYLEGENLNIYDQHLHTNFSPDSREEMETYVQKAKENGDTCFVTTEHLDFRAHSMRGRDIIPDYNMQQFTAKMLADKYKMDVLFGVEAGYRAAFHDRMEQMIVSQPFDFVLASIHENDEQDFYEIAIAGTRTPEDIFDEYLDLVKNMITNFKNFDVLAHIDFPLRFMENVKLAPFEAKIKDIFSMLIAEEKTFELNTKTITTCGIDYFEQYLKWYIECGGIYLSLGSDGHDIRAHKIHFDKAIPLLKKYNVKEVSGYKNRKRFGMEI